MTGSSSKDSRKRKPARGGSSSPTPPKRSPIGKYAGTEIKIDDEEHLILREDEVLAVVEK